MTEFKTSRLTCRSLTLSEYSQFEAGVEPVWGDCVNPFHHLTEGRTPLSHRIPRVILNPAFAEIGLLLAILTDTREIIGSAGFHDFPDEQGMIEIGFGIVPQKQNQGYGTELLHGMWRMISDLPTAKVFRYTVSPTNQPSLHIINALQFDLVGEQIDPEDGVELIYEMSRNDYLAKWK